MNPESLLQVYEWVDSIPLSRKKTNISRDFSDGRLFAEVVKFYFPRLVDVHNYPDTLNSAQKLDNWITLCSKVLKKIGFSMTGEEIDNYGGIAGIMTYVIEDIQEIVGENISDDEKKRKFSGDNRKNSNVEENLENSKIIKAKNNSQIKFKTLK